MRPVAVCRVGALGRRGYALGISSGDTPDAVMPVAAALGIDAAQSGLLPTEKTARLASLATAGRKALMVGDGLNDAPALVAAHVSIAPGSAAAVGRQAADRSAERRVGKEGVRTCGSRWSPTHSKKKNTESKE